MPYTDFAALCAELVPRVVTAALGIVMAYVSVCAAVNGMRGRHA
jgi:hypothetical protein